MENKRKKKPSMQKRLLLTLDGVLVLGVLVAVVVLIVTRFGGSGTKAEGSAEEPAAQTVAETQSVAETQNVAVSADSLAYFSWGSNGEAPVSIDFDLLAGTGINAVGWLYCDGTSINSPVMQAADNEYYMTRNAFGKKDASGAIYLDGRNSPGLEDEQIMLYGNPMEDGSMFGGLLNYRDQGFYDAHPSMYYITPTGAYRIDVYASHTASPQMSNYPIWFENEAARNTYIRAQQANSFITASPDTAAGTLVSLVTCSDFDAGENARFMVNGVLVPIS